MKLKTALFTLLKMSTKDKKEAAITNATFVFLLSCFLITIYQIITGNYLIDWDNKLHIYWANDFFSALNAHWAAPKWAMNSDHGLGQPVFLFYGPLFYYFVSFLRLFVDETSYAITSLVALVYIGFFSSAYYFSKKVTLIHRAIDAFLCCLAPTLIFILCRTGSYPWYLASFFVFLSIYTTNKIISNEYTKYTVIANSFFIFCICITHTLSGFMILLVSGLTHTFLVFKIKKGSVFISGLSTALGLVASSFYLIPALYNLPSITSEGWNLGGTPYDNAFSIPIFGIADNTPRWPLINWYISGIIIFSSLSLFFSSNDRKASEFTVVIFTVSLIFSTELSYILYKKEILSIVQFPYRFIVISTLSGIVFNLALGKINKPFIITSSVGILLTLAMHIQDIKGLSSNNSFLNLTSTQTYKGQPEYFYSGRAVGKMMSYELKLTQGTRYSEKGLSVDVSQVYERSLPINYFPKWKVFHCGSKLYSYMGENNLLTLEEPPKKNESCGERIMIHWDKTRIEKLSEVATWISVFTWLSIFFLREDWVERRNLITKGKIKQNSR